MILGTGTNACYVEKRIHVQCMVPDVISSPRHNAMYSLETVINTEWGAFESEFVPLMRVRNNTPVPGLLRVCSCTPACVHVSVL